MNLSRNALIAIIIALSLAIISSLAVLINKRNQSNGIEIRLDKSGLRIQEN